MTIVESLKHQIAEEIGDAELTKEQKRIVLQKFGIVIPYLTSAERRIIFKEQRRIERHGSY